MIGTISDPTTGQPEPVIADGQRPGPGQPLVRPGPNPTVDLVVTRDRDGRRQVLLIRRADREGVAERGRWAFPGGFHDSDAPAGERWTPGRETALDAALRELAEETGLDARFLAQRVAHVGFYDRRDRDPRNSPAAWTVSNAFALHLDGPLADADVEGTDDADDAGWFFVDGLPGRLAFDHDEILAAALND